MVGSSGEVITPVSFRVVPVIDLKGGMAVHAVGGRRDQYRPLRGIWQASGSPITLAIALREGLGADHLYLADLDAIAGQPPHREVYEGMIDAGMTLWLDAGVGDQARLAPLLDLDPERSRLVLGLESVAGPDELARLVTRIGAGRAIFSLDMDSEVPRIAAGAAWPGREPGEIADRAIACGVRTLILLDLARVGTGRGIGTGDMLVRLRTHHPSVAVTVGGGIRGIEDVLRMKQLGASAVLVGSAIHDGRIGRDELERIGTGSS
jgi:phosphoribosylformimino-5-aminoimidazole carboxamide ribotide isomerase